jgi:hypothetical protein
LVRPLVKALCMLCKDNRLFDKRTPVYLSCF